MTTFIATLGALIVLILFGEILCWNLFYRKMEPLHFPAKTTTSSHYYYVRRLRTTAFVHTVTLCGCTWIFLASQW